MTNTERSIKTASALYTQCTHKLCCRGEGWLRRPRPFIQLSSCYLWEARPRQRHTDRSNGPVTYKTSCVHSLGSQASSLFSRLPNKVVMWHMCIGSMLHCQISLTGGRRLLQSHNNTHNIRPIALYMTYGNSSCGLETHTALCASCCMNLSTTPPHSRISLQTHIICYSGQCYSTHPSKVGVHVLQQ